MKTSTLLILLGAGVVLFLLMSSQRQSDGFGFNLGISGIDSLWSQ